MEMCGNAYPPFVPPGAAMETRTIRIIDGQYNLRFTMQDGEWITVDGVLYQVFYIDECHIRIEGPNVHNCQKYYHTCQFGKLTFDRGRDVHKVEA